jgi:4-aminobutyrate aminotransferase-like enzyme
MARVFELTPRSVPKVSTGLRKIVTELPAAASLPVLEKLHALEPLAMRGQPPVVWDHAEGFQVFDANGNCWIDWSSGVLITNAGHGRQQIIDAIVKQVSSHLLTNYAFPSEIRSQLVDRLATLLPEPLKKIFLLTTGSETVECVIKLCRMHGVKAGGRGKHAIISFTDAFHGRTMGAQQAGGIPALKEWIVNLDKGFVQVPFPDGYRTPDVSFDFFLRSLSERGVEASNVAGVILETYQGGSAAFAPQPFMQALRQWCTGHKILLVCDEVQAGFGRTGTLFGFEHYGMVPDLATFGKGITSSLPLAAVAGRPDIMDLAQPGSMTSTHTGNPVCCAAALASIDLVLSEDLTGNARTVGTVLHEGLQRMKSRFPAIGQVHGKGLVAGVLCVHPGTKKPDGDLAFEVVRLCFEKGVLMFAPVGVEGGTVKIAPPLTITREAVLESVQVLEEAFEEASQKAAAARS